MPNIAIKASTLNIQRRTDTESGTVSHLTFTGKDSDGSSYNLQIPSELWNANASNVVDDALADILNEVASHYESFRGEVNSASERVSSAHANFVKAVKRAANIRSQRSVNTTLDGSRYVTGSDISSSVPNEGVLPNGSIVRVIENTPDVF